MARTKNVARMPTDKVPRSAIVTKKSKPKPKKSGSKKAKRSEGSGSTSRTSKGGFPRAVCCVGIINKQNPFYFSMHVNAS